MVVGGGDCGLVEGYVAILLPENWVPVLLPDGYPGTKIPESPSTNCEELLSK